MNTHNRTQNRRQFLKSGSRGILLGGLVLLGTVLGLRTPTEGRDCILDLPCRNCSSFKGCPDPKAIEFKRNWRDPQEVERVEG